MNPNIRRLITDGKFFCGFCTKTVVRDVNISMHKPRIATPVKCDCGQYIPRSNQIK